MPQVMLDDRDYVERLALDMIDQFGAGAAHVARKLAEASDEVQDDILRPAETWRDIANAIERVLAESMGYQSANGYG